MAKESICRNCFHSYVCEQFNENKDDNNEKCHFFNDHYVSATDLVPKSEVERWRRNLEAVLEERAETRTEVAREIFEEIKTALKLYKQYDFRSGTYFECYLEADIAELKKKYTEGETDAEIH